ncbi:HdeD family acid-resistance protein [Candidimonas humi]|uniref:HdeD family acid-resistance protein n=1 Tax=Candidimonas humi TaxID=683355 RepID=A0ABV8NUH5_9BURK|nr:HdeD family acid-resistance protein [Candidimonas humi]MBV6303713.1 HdeD family acid-resistance protein [Candidimonas humi]
MTENSVDTARNPLAAIGGAWWLLLLRGIVAILFGILAFLWPGKSLLALILVYGIYTIADGIFSLGGAIRGGGLVPRWWLALAGVASLAAGVIAFGWPGLTVVVMVTLIGVWSIVRGVLEIIGAIKLRKVINNEWLLALAGVVSVLFGLALVAMPGFGALVLLWIIGSWAIVFGVLFISLAFRLKKLHGSAQG